MNVAGLEAQKASRVIHDLLPHYQAFISASVTSTRKRYDVVRSVNDGMIRYDNSLGGGQVIHPYRDVDVLEKYI